MTIFLHVGVGKTGTTTLQVYLEQHHDTLAERGVFVARAPRSRNHRALAMYALDDDVIDNARKAKRLTSLQAIESFRSDLRTRMIEEAAGLPSDATLVFSSEQMTRLSRPTEFLRLRELLSLYGHHEIKIIAYLRRQDLYYSSSYSQYIKGGQNIEMAPSPKLMKQSVYDYRRFLSGWAEAFGDENIIVRVFERGQLVKGDIIADFFDAVGFRDYGDLTVPPRQNQSLDMHTIQYLRELNPYMPRFNNGKVNKRRPRLIAALEAISDGPKVRLGPDEARAFLQLFEEGNAEIARRFLGRENGVLFHDEISEEPALKPQMDHDKAMEISARLFDKLMKG